MRPRVKTLRPWRDFFRRYSESGPASRLCLLGKSGRDFEPGNSRISSGSSGIWLEKVLAGFFWSHSRRCLSCLRCHGEKSGRDFARYPSRTRRLTRTVPRPRSSGGISSREKGRKTRNLAFFTKRVPVGLRPARTEAYRGTYMPYIGGMPLYAAAGSPRGTRSGFRCNPGRNPGAIFSSHPSRAIPTRDPIDRRMPGGNRDSDIVSEAPSVAAGFPGVATLDQKTATLCCRHERRCERSKVASEYSSTRRSSGAKKGPVRTGVKWARREGPRAGV